MRLSLPKAKYNKKNKHNQSYKILRNIEFTFTLAYSVLIKIAYFNVCINVYCRLLVHIKTMYKI